MSRPDDGGFAFPVPHAIDGNWNKEPFPEYSGMSLRAYIAVHRPVPDAMPSQMGLALLGRPLPDQDQFPDTIEGHLAHTLACQQWWAAVSAAYSVMQADALIAALKAPANG
ncbi:hypothetical protein [Nevskia ramosa]|uniref:hypothetical protein n=1 Tax=Nevskia ramosa TaxID=64002 RepID=UPI003D0BC2AC